MTKKNVWICLITGTLLVLIQIFLIVKSNSFFTNFRFNSLVQNEAISKKISLEKILSGNSLNFEFKANNHNLGTIEFLFNNYNKINTDIIVFKIKEKGAKDWYYQNSYKSSKFDIGQFYPFGFPLIQNSKDKTYEIEISSQYGTANNSVSLSQTSDHFQVKYFYTKSFLTQNFWLFPNFLIRKFINCLGFLKYSDLTKLIETFVVPFFIYFAYKTIIRILIYLYPKNIKLKKISFRQILDFVKTRIAIISIVVFYSITHMQFLAYSQYWDANLYWNSLLDAISKFSNTPLNPQDIVFSFISNFNVLGHLSMGYMSIMSLSQVISGNNVISLNIENMLLATMAIWAFYNIVKFFYPSKIYENILITLIFAFNPLFYATSISFNTDFPLLVFTVLLIEAFLNKKRFLFLFWSIMLVFSKVTGGLIYFSFVFFYSIISILNKRFILQWKNKITQVFISYIPILVFIFYYIYSHGKLWINNDNSEFNIIWGNTCNFCFGLNEGNIGVRLFQIFILNFSWIASLIIVMSIHKSLVIGSRFFGTIAKEKLHFIEVFILTFLTFVSFNLITVVMNFPRYVVTGVFFLTLIMYISLDSLFLNTKIRLSVLSILFLLLFIQTFKAIDPSPQFFYGTRYLGKNISSPIFGFNDAMVYNTQFVFLDGLTDMIKKDTPEGSVLINDLATSYFYRNLNNVGMIEDFKNLEKKGYKKFRYILVPWMSDGREFHKQINILFKVIQSKTLDYKGYTVEVYDIERI